MADEHFRVVQISDLHADPGNAADKAMLARVADRLASLKPDLIVASGDVSADGYQDPARLDRVKAYIDQWPAPVLIIPGNHDIGERRDSSDNRQHYLAEWLRIFGSDRFTSDRGQWRLIGINTELMDTGLDAEREQFSWLDAQLDEAERRGLRVAMFLHGPPYLIDRDENFTDHSAFWGLRPKSRQRVLKQIERPHVRLLANGHLHWHRESTIGDKPWIWCPSAKGAVEDAKFPPGGERVGVMVYQFHGDSVSYELSELEPAAELYHFGYPRVPLPDREPLVVAHVLLDWCAAVSADGKLKAGVAERLRQLGGMTRIVAVTSSAKPTADAPADLPVTFRHITSPAEKAALVDELGGDSLAAIVNGSCNEPAMQKAAVRIAVNVREDCGADVTAADLNEAMDLLGDPDRLAARMSEAGKATS